mgnify:CR=1 FL=1
MNGYGVQSRFARKAESRVRLGITRGQALAVLLGIALFFYVMIELVFAPVAKGSVVLPETPVQPVLEVTVQQGDSLWKLANLYREKSDLETGELIQKIKEANDLEGVMIYPGQTLVIPLG